MAEHRVELVQLLDALQQALLLLELLARSCRAVSSRAISTIRSSRFGQELVQRRIDRPDGDRRSRASP